MAGYGGVGGELASIWIFKLASYDLLDKLFNDKENEVTKVYIEFFNMMEKVKDKIRQEVIFN